MKQQQRRTRYENLFSQLFASERLLYLFYDFSILLCIIILNRNIDGNIVDALLREIKPKKEFNQIYKCYMKTGIQIGCH